MSKDSLLLRRPAETRKLNILLIFVSIVVVAATLELGTRFVLGFVYHREVPEVWKLAYEPYLMYYSHDRSGLKRDDEYVVYPAKGDRYRILIIGGSTAAQMPSAMVAEVFQSLTDRKVDVVNLADGGYIANQALVMLAVHGAKLEPDLIISLDGFNDIVNMTKKVPPGIHYHDRSIRYAVEHPIMNGVRSLFTNSQFMLAIVKLQERRDEMESQTDVARFAEFRRAYVSTIMTTAKLAKGIDAAYVPVLQPYLHLRKTLTEREKGLERLWAFRSEFMRRAFTDLNTALSAQTFSSNTHFVSALTAFDSVDAEIFTDQCHVTDLGKRIALEFIRDRAVAEGFNAGKAHLSGNQTLSRR